MPGLEAAALAFETLYARIYGEGAGFREAGIHALTFRVRGVGVLPVSPTLPAIERSEGSESSVAVVEHRPICLDARKGYVNTPVFDYRRLRAGHRVDGPAVIQVPTTTVVVPDGMTGVVDDLGNLRVATL